MTRFWLSFCDPDKPEGSRFLGVAIVEAAAFPIALEKAWLLGINPGGEVLGYSLADTFEIEKEDMDRLLTKEEVRKYV